MKEILASLLFVTMSYCDIPLPMLVKQNIDLSPPVYAYRGHKSYQCYLFPFPDDTTPPIEEGSVLFVAERPLSKGEMMRIEPFLERSIEMIFN